MELMLLMNIDFGCSRDFAVGKDNVIIIIYYWNKFLFTVKIINF